MMVFIFFVVVVVIVGISNHHRHWPMTNSSETWLEIGRCNLLLLFKQMDSHTHRPRWMKQKKNSKLTYIIIVIFLSFSFILFCYRCWPDVMMTELIIIVIINNEKIRKTFNSQYKMRTNERERERERDFIFIHKCACFYLLFIQKSWP